MSTTNDTARLPDAALDRAATPRHVAVSMARDAAHEELQDAYLRCFDDRAVLAGEVARLMRSGLPETRITPMSEHDTVSAALERLRMTLQELAERSKVDPETAHHLADVALIDYINDSEVAVAFNNIKKWYS